MAAVSGCDGDTVRFRLADPDRVLAAVRLRQRVGLTSTDLVYDESGRAWTLTAPRPAAWRIEYEFELTHADGRTECVTDPDNDRRVGTAFGDRSVLECPDYAPPAWWDAPVEADAGKWREWAVPAPSLAADVPVKVLSPAVPADSGPGLALVAHDGPEFDRLGGLGRFSAAMTSAGRLPPHHLVLLAPGHRDDWYSANPDYARALTAEVLPAISDELGGPHRLVGVGASLGGLAMLHAHRLAPDVFAGLFLQSGSFFLPRLDPQERGFSHYRRIVRFVAAAMREPGRPVPITITCGTVEENLANNRCLAHALRAQDCPVAFVEVPDGHNFTAWRDALDPHLTELCRLVWRDAL